MVKIKCYGCFESVKHNHKIITYPKGKQIGGENA